MDRKKCSAIARMGIAKYLFFIIGQFFLLSVFLRGLLQYNRFNLKSLLRGEAVIFRKRYRKGMRFIFLAEPFDLSLKDACPPKRLWLFDKIFYNDIEFTRMGKGNPCLAERLLHPDKWQLQHPEIVVLKYAAKHIGQQ